MAFALLVTMLIGCAGGGADLVVPSTPVPDAPPPIRVRIFDGASNLLSEQVVDLRTLPPAVRSTSGLDSVDAMYLMRYTVEQPLGIADSVNALLLARGTDTVRARMLTRLPSALATRYDLTLNDSVYYTTDNSNPALVRTTLKAGATVIATVEVEVTGGGGPALRAWLRQQPAALREEWSCFTEFMVMVTSNGAGVALVFEGLANPASAPVAFTGAAALFAAGLNASANMQEAGCWDVALGWLDALWQGLGDLADRITPWDGWVPWAVETAQNAW